MSVGFFRTPPGASAKPLFVGDDTCIVYVEGNNNSIDLHFWNHILTLNFDSQNFRFECYGSKTNVLAISEEPRFLTNPILLCVDGDLDFHSSNTQGHIRIVKTDGYSVENEAIRLCSRWTLILNTVKNIALDSSNCEAFLSPIFDEIYSVLSQPNIMIQILKFNDIEFKMIDIHSFIEIRNDTRPIFNREAFDGYVLRLMTEQNVNNILAPTELCYDPFRSFRGHSLFKLFMHLLIYELNENFNTQALLRTMILDIIPPDETLASHYNPIVSAAVIDASLYL